jgi:hypothetical protein
MAETGIWLRQREGTEFRIAKGDKADLHSWTYDKSVQCSWNGWECYLTMDKTDHKSSNRSRSTMWQTTEQWHSHCSDETQHRPDWLIHAMTDAWKHELCFILSMVVTVTEITEELGYSEVCARWLPQRLIGVHKETESSHHWFLTII